MILINTNETLSKLAQLALASNVGLNGTIAGLFTGTPTITRLTSLSNLTEASFPGYARLTNIDWGNLVRLPDYGWGYLGERLQFTMNGASGNGAVITGGFLLQGANNSKLLCAGFFDNPQSVNVPGDTVNWSPAITFDFNSDSDLIQDLDS